MVCSLAVIIGFLILTSTTWPALMENLIIINHALVCGFLLGININISILISSGPLHSSSAWCSAASTFVLFSFPPFWCIMSQSCGWVPVATASRRCFVWSLGRLDDVTNEGHEYGAWRLPQTLKSLFIHPGLSSEQLSTHGKNRILMSFLAHRLLTELFLVSVKTLFSIFICFEHQWQHPLCIF